jgi:colanic acid/amylovoran biosynthesis glycosyltransferase
VKPTSVGWPAVFLVMAGPQYEHAGTFLNALNPSKPLVASYCTYFLKSEMQHIYRQMTGLTEFVTFVITKFRQNADAFPFPDVEKLVPARQGLLRRGYLKYLQRKPALIYRGEFEAIRRILIRRDPALMHIYFGNTGVHLLPLIRRWDRPCVVSFHGMDVQHRPEEKGYEQRLRELLQIVPLVLVRSRSIADRLQELDCSPDKIRMSRAGIPLGGFPLADRSFPADGRWLLVQACRLVPKKGLFTSLEAFSVFRRRYPAARFIIAGEGPLQESIKNRIGELRIDDSVTLSGFLDQTRLRSIFEQAHLFIHPSCTTQDGNQEGVPNSMLEAMATGLPVVATRHGGIPEAVKDGEQGYLVGEQDVAGLASALVKLAADPELWRQFGLAASAKVAQRFEQSQQVKRLEEAYWEVLERWRELGARS